MKYIAKVLFVIIYYILYAIAVVIGCIWNLNLSKLKRALTSNYLDVFDEAAIRKLSHGDTYFVYTTALDWIIGRKTFLTK